MIRLLTHPLHPLPSVSSTVDPQEDRKRDLADEKGGREEGWARSRIIRSKKAWSSINHSILTEERYSKSPVLASQSYLIPATASQESWERGGERGGEGREVWRKKVS
jgi:hypothetical protein